MATKITTFTIGLIISSLFVTIIAVFMGNVSNEYNIDYDNSTFDTYNKLNTIAEDTNSIKTEVEGIKEKTGILDIIGSIFSDGYQALKLTVSSFSTFEVMLNQALTDLNIGVSGELIRIAFMSIVLVLIFIGVMIRIIVKATEL